MCSDSYVKKRKKSKYSLFRGIKTCLQLSNVDNCCGQQMNLKKQIKEGRKMLSN